MAVRRVGRIVPRAEKKSLDIKKKNKNINNKVLVVAQEIKFAKILAGNDKKSRDKVLRHLKKWLTYRSSSTYDFTEQDFMRLWKGLFYCVWMSDKPLVQEELCENISKLFECFGSDKIETCILFFKCFLSTLAADWFGIDQHRLDKFLMFVRRMTRGMLKCLQEQKWSTKSLKLINECLTGDGGIFSIDHPKLCLGLQMHFVDCWIEEVAKVSGGDISAKTVVALTKPFAQFLSYGEETRLASSITRNIFIHLVRQTDIGIEYQERLHAWKRAGFPGGSVDAMERVEIENGDGSDQSEDDQSVNPTRSLGLDPRAGHVDTELPQLSVDGTLFSAMLKKLTADSTTTKGNRDKLRNLAIDFETLASGSYPYKMKNVVLESDPKFKLPKIQKTALDLLEFEESMKLQNEDDELMGMNKRQRRKYLMKQKKMLEAGLHSDEEEEDETDVSRPPKKTPPKKAKRKSNMGDGEWTVENMDIPETPQSDTNLSSVTSTRKEKKVNNSKSSNGSFDNSTPSKKKTLIAAKKEPRTPQLDSTFGDEKESKVNNSKLSNGSHDNSTVSKNKTLIAAKNKPRTPQLDSTSGEEKQKKVKNSTPSQKKVLITSKREPRTPRVDSTLDVATSEDKHKCSVDKKKNVKNSKLSLDNSTPSCKKVLIASKKEPKTPRLNSSLPLVTSSGEKQKKLKNSRLSNISFDNSSPSQKKVLIALKKNTSQGVMDYFKSVKQSPEIPFDGERKPLKTSLKPNAMPSPINPFYKKKLKLNF